MSTHGLRIDLAADGEPRPLHAEAGLTLYRTAQEALTNTAKHAGRGARAELRLTWARDHVELVVCDTRRDGTAPRLLVAGTG